jgi:hypothetical protein
MIKEDLKRKNKVHVQAETNRGKQSQTKGHENSNHE